MSTKRYNIGGLWPFAIVFQFTLLLFMGGCDTSVDYSDNPHHILSLSADTISFDTIFTSIGSATVSMMIYNKNAVALRFSASLAGAESSDFRMNIDGESGVSVHNIEIRSNDSLYLFITVTINPDQIDTPLFATDSVLFTLESGVTQSVNLIAYGQNVNIVRGATILSDSVFLANKPYLIYDSLFIGPEATLRIMPGTTLYFHKGAGLGVLGTLIAAGTLDSIITFRTDRLDNLFSDLPYANLSGQWEGLRFYPGSYYNNLEYCQIQGSRYGISAVSRSSDTLTLSLNSIVIHNTEGNGFEAVNCNVIVGNSLFSNAGGNCVSLVGGRSHFLFCTIANFYPWGERDKSLAVSNKVLDALFPLYEATFVNCVITGSENEALGGVLIDSLSPQLNAETSLFIISNSLLLTTDTLRGYFSNIVLDQSENPVSGSGNFRIINSVDYIYNFRLDSLSPARNIANKEYVTEYPIDISGIPRTDTDQPDAGCYQFTLY